MSADSSAEALAEAEALAKAEALAEAEAKAAGLEPVVAKPQKEDPS